MPKAAIYARYSSDLQTPQSIDDQFRLCRILAEREGWDIVAAYQDEAASGASIRGREGIARLLNEARAGRFEIVCAEALDRISRDQEDMAHIHKLLRFAGVAIHTVAEGRADELHIGFKGTMNALFLKDLADKTRRGQRGRVEKGRSGGGLAHGYDVVLHDEDGAGGRRINEQEAMIVRRIFRAFAAGETPAAIATGLNRELIPGPAGHPWGATKIRGHKMRGTGILNNELYRGVLVWNRLRYIKDPVTGKRQARLNPAAEWIRKEVPALRIIEESLWQAVKERQLAQEQCHTDLRDGIRKAREVRAQHPGVGLSNFHRLVICADCGGEFCAVGRDRYGCAHHYRRKTCCNSKTLQRRAMEAGIRDLLVETVVMMGEHAEAFGDEENLAARHLRGQTLRERRELEAIETRLGGLLVAIEGGLYTPRMKLRFQQLEDRAERLRTHLQAGTERLNHLQAQEKDGSRETVASLIADLQTGDDERAILKLRRMIGPIMVTPRSAHEQCPLNWRRTPG
ncbi:recombinase family protein [Pseudochelatococcus sp. B33]